MGSIIFNVILRQPVCKLFLKWRDWRTLLGLIFIYSRAVRINQPPADFHTFLVPTALYSELQLTLVPDLTNRHYLRGPWEIFYLFFNFLVIETLKLNNFNLNDNFNFLSLSNCELYLLNPSTFLKVRKSQKLSFFAPKNQRKKSS